MSTGFTKTVLGALPTSVFFQNNTFRFALSQVFLTLILRMYMLSYGPVPIGERHFFKGKSLGRKKSSPSMNRSHSPFVLDKFQLFVL